MDKVCKNCDQKKIIELFSINYKKNNIIYYRNICKDCYKIGRKGYHKEYNKIYYQKIKNNKI